MFLYVVRRVLLAIVTVWAVATVTFFLAYLVPGDPALLRYGEHATPQAIAAWRHLHGMDAGPITRYLHYMARLLHGDLGVSSLPTSPSTPGWPVVFRRPRFSPSSP